MSELSKKERIDSVAFAIGQKISLVLGDPAYPIVYNHTRFLAEAAMTIADATNPEIARLKANYERLRELALEFIASWDGDQYLLNLDSYCAKFEAMRSEVER